MNRSTQRFPKAAGRSWRIVLASSLIVAFAGAFAVGVTGSARAAAAYDLLGTWDTYGTGGGYSGTFTISHFDRSSGAFSGTGDGTTFALKGSESGDMVTFTQSEGSYVATDTATLQLSGGKLQMIDGVWSDSNGSGGSFTASITSIASISGTVTRDGQGIGGVTLTASTDFGDSASAVSADNGSYTISVPKKGVWRVTPSGLGFKFKPKDHIVTVDGDETGWDFKAIGGPSIEALSKIVTGQYIQLDYQGKHWDPDGGPIALSFGGVAAGSVVAASTIRGDVKVNYWPRRHTINNDKDPPGKACWGTLKATQGSESASAEFEGRAAGVIIWSLDPRIATGQVYCDGEENGLLFGGGDIIALKFRSATLDIYNGPSSVYRSIPVSQLQGGHHLCYYSPTPNVHVVLTLNRGVVHAEQSSGACP
jgi:Carboxypeptidase regulatory-like domain